MLKELTVETSPCPALKTILLPQGTKRRGKEGRRDLASCPEWEPTENREGEEIRQSRPENPQRR